MFVAARRGSKGVNAKNLHKICTQLISAYLQRQSRQRTDKPRLHRIGAWGISKLSDEQLQISSRQVIIKKKFASEFSNCNLLLYDRIAMHRIVPYVTMKNIVNCIHCLIIASDLS